MKKRIIPGFLFMIMMIVVLHNAIPHHHHEGHLMHRHDMHQDDRNSDPGDDHHPEKCIIQSIDISVPRVHSAKNLALSCPTDNIAALINTDSSSITGFTISYIKPSYWNPPSKGISTGFPSRGPPSFIIA